MRKRFTEDSHAVGFLFLVHRSQKGDERWASVSDLLRRTAETETSKHSALYETKESDGRLNVRLSLKGEVLAEYL